MTAVWLIARRELGAYLRTMSGYIIAAIVLFVDGILFNVRSAGVRFLVRSRAVRKLIASNHGPASAGERARGRVRPDPSSTFNLFGALEFKPGGESWVHAHGGVAALPGRLGEGECSWSPIIVAAGFMDVEGWTGYDHQVMGDSIACLNAQTLKPALPIGRGGVLRIDLSVTSGRLGMKRHKVG